MIEVSRRESPRTGAEIRATIALFAPGLAPNARAILLLLWTYARPREEPAIAYPSAVRMGRELGISERKVRDNLARLQAAGAIDRVKYDGRRVWLLNRTPPSGSSQTGPSRPDRKPDPSVPQPDASVPQNRTPASPEDQVKNKEEEQDHSRGGQTGMPWAPDPAEPDVVAELWDMQNRMRREIDPALRDLKLTPERRAPVAARLAADGRDACEHVLAVYAAEAKAKGDATWFNGETNWRPRNFLRALSRPISGAPASSRGAFTPRDGATLEHAKAAGLRLVED